MSHSLPPSPGSSAAGNMAGLSPSRSPGFHKPTSPNPVDTTPSIDTPNGVATDAHSSGSDEDAEGDEDAEYEAEPSPQSGPARTPSERRPSHQSSRSSQHNTSHDDGEDWLKNPELYGLRRSKRERPSRPMAETSSDEDDSDVVVNRRARKQRRLTPGIKASRQNTPVFKSAYNSDPDSDDYVGAKRDMLSKKERRRRKQVVSGLAPPTQAEVRFSSRNAQKVTNYNEDEDDEFEEEDAQTTANYWASVAADKTPAIDVILDHRLREDLESTPTEPGKGDFEYLIKWQDQAHYHATWETIESIESLRKSKKLDNYFKKTLLEDYYYRYDPSVPPEDKEAFMMTREEAMDKLHDFRKVHRVIATREGDEDTEYLVKWRGLNYDMTTWETASLVSSIAQPAIDRFLDVSARPPMSNRTESNPNTRSAFRPIYEQPDYVKHGQLRAFQLRGLNFLAKNWCDDRSVILADEMGLGKTVQTIAFISYLMHERQQEGPFLVVVPLSTVPAWSTTFDNWAPDVNYVVYTGNEKSRNTIVENELFVENNLKRVKFNVLLTTYEFANQENSIISQLKWQLLAVDEAHRLKNKDSSLYARLSSLNVAHSLLITGTPMQNTLMELSALMNFLEPGKIQIDDKEANQSIEQQSKLIGGLIETIKPYILRRTKGTVETDLPPKTEKTIRVELADVQVELYKNILSKNYSALNAGSKGTKQSLLNIVMELKKASNHPFLFPNIEDQICSGNEAREARLRALISSSGKLMLLDQLLTKLKKDGHRVLIFSQMVSVLNILVEYFQLRGFRYQRLDGTIGSATRQRAIDHFNAPGSEDFVFCLSTRAGGLGINLASADTIVIFDSDWNPQQDLQASARAHRIGQTKPVTVYRFVSKDTVEEEVLERARNKLFLEFLTIQRGVTDKDAKEISDRFHQHGKGTDEPTSTDDISQILKRRSKKMFEQTGNQKKLEELDIDAVLENAEVHRTGQEELTDNAEAFLKNFEYTDVKVDDLGWDDIIPEEQLKAIKAEEKAREDERFLASLAGPSEKRKRQGPQQEDEPSGRAAKKRARNLNAARAGSEDTLSDVDSDTADPRRPLSEKEIRNFIRAYERYGSFHERRNDILRDSKLVGRNIDLVEAMLADVLNKSREMIREHRERLEALQRENGPNQVAKKDKKAILFDYNKVKRLNAETLLERPDEMRLLREATSSVPDWRNFRVPEASKAADYDCEWKAREDGMLCVGIARHGFGAWSDIRDDPELGMTDKFFLEEHRVDKKTERVGKTGAKARSPGAVHLVRRANYLLSVLKEKYSSGNNAAARKAVENHHRTNKRHGHTRRADHSASVSASPAPSGVTKSHRETGKARPRADSQADRRNGDSHRDDSRRPESRLGENGRAGASEHRHKPSGERRSNVDSKTGSERKRKGSPDEHQDPSAKRRRSNESVEQKPSTDLKRKAPTDEQKDPTTKRHRSNEQAPDGIRPHATGPYSDLKLVRNGIHEDKVKRHSEPSKYDSLKPVFRKDSQSLKRKSEVESSKAGPVKRQKSEERTAPSRGSTTGLAHAHKDGIKKVAPSQKSAAPVDDAVAREMSGVRTSLDSLRNTTKSKFPDKGARAKSLRNHLLAVGDHIHHDVRKASKISTDRAWAYVCKHFWPSSNVEPSALEQMYNKSKKPASAQPNGAAASPTN